MDSPPPLLNKPAIGGIALVCLALAGGLYLIDPSRDALVGALVRVGVVMGALWIALPKPGETMRWGGVAVVPVIALLLASTAVLKQRMVVILPILIAVFVLWTFFRPRPPVRPPRRFD